MNFINIKNAACVLGAATLLGLAGCGGGGSSSSGTTGTTVTGANAKPIAALSLTGLSLNSLGNSLATSNSAGITGIQVSGTTQNGTSVRSLVNYVAKQVETQSSTPQVLNGMTLIATRLCQAGVTGSGTIGMTDTRPQGQVGYFSTDVITMTFANCVSTAGGSSMNGTVTISKMTFSGTGAVGTNPLTGATMTFNLTDTSSTGVISFNNVAIGFTPTSDSLAGTGITITSGSNVTSLTNFTISSSTATNGDVTDTTTFTLSDTSIGGSLTFNNATPFITHPLQTYPYTGVMEITSTVSGATGSLRLTVNGDGTYTAGPQLAYDFFPNGFNQPRDAVNSGTASWLTI